MRPAPEEFFARSRHQLEAIRRQMRADRSQLRAIFFRLQTTEQVVWRATAAVVESRALLSDGRDGSSIPGRV